MSRFIQLFIVFSFIEISFSAHAQHFRHLSVKDGLSDLVVNAIYKDSLGYMWFGTSSSVERFDGYRFKHYRIPEDNDLSRDVNAIIEMPHNEIWFGNNTGLWCINRNEQLIRVKADSISGPVYALARQDSCLYAGTKNGLYIIHHHCLERILLEANVLSIANEVHGLALDNERLWMATTDGLYAMRLTDKAIERYRPKDEKMTRHYTSIHIQNGVLYLGLEEWGIVPFHIDRRSFGKVIPVGPVTGFSSSRKDNVLYAATNGRGIYVLSTPENQIVQHITHRPESGEGIRSNSVYSILVDREGILWAGLFQIGIDHSLYQQKLFSIYAPDRLAALRHAAIRCLAFGQDGTQAFGTRDGLFLINDEKQLYRYYRNELRAAMVMCVHFHQDRYYIGTFGGGMHILNPQTGALSNFDTTVDAFVRGQVFTITTDADDCLWIGTNEGLFCYKEGRMIHHYTEHNSKLPHPNVYQVFFDSTGRGWVCTGLGLALVELSAGHALHTRFPDHFVNNKLIRNVYEASDHRLYFCPDKGNLFVSDLSLSHFHSVSIDAIKDKSLQFVIEDDNHWLWVGTNDGLFRYDGESKAKSYGFVDGLPTTNFLNCIPYKGSDGPLWFGTSQGVVLTDTHRINTEWSYPYSLRFTEASFEDSNHPIPLSLATGAVTLPSTAGKLTLRFSDFTYTDPQELLLEYRIGEKDEWHPLNGSAELTLFNLRGDSQLQLRHHDRPDSVIALAVNAPLLAFSQWLWMAIALIGAGGGLFLYKKRRTTVHQEKSLSPADAEASTAKYKQVNLSTKDCQALANALEQLMRQQKPYLNPKLKVTDLAQLLEVPTYKLSYLLSQHLKQTFYDYINEYRIGEFKTLVAEGRHKSYTINTLIEQCGFTSRTSFFRNFKATEGMTPNEYISKNGQPE